MVNKKQHFGNQRKVVRASIDEVKANVETLAQRYKSSYGEELRNILPMTEDVSQMKDFIHESQR